jgi:hypothetical protein
MLELGTYSAIYDLLYKGITLLYSSPILVAGYPIMAKKKVQSGNKKSISILKKLILFEVIIFSYNNNCFSQIIFYCALLKGARKRTKCQWKTFLVTVVI